MKARQIVMNIALKINSNIEKFPAIDDNCNRKFPPKRFPIKRSRLTN
jgi:hypothetical protein